MLSGLVFTVGFMLFSHLQNVWTGTSAVLLVTVLVVGAHILFVVCAVW